MSRAFRRVLCVLIHISMICMWAIDAQALGPDELIVPGWVFFRTSPLLPNETEWKDKSIKVAQIMVNKSAVQHYSNGKNDYTEIEVDLLNVYGENREKKSRPTVRLLNSAYSRGAPDEVVRYPENCFVLLREHPDGLIELIRRDRSVFNGRF